MAMRDEKGRFLNAAQVREVVKSQMTELVKDRIVKFANDVYGKSDQKAVLKAYRAVFNVSHVESYRWAKAINLKD